MDKLRETRPFYGCLIKNGKYFDCGNKLEYLKAQVYFGLQNPEMKDDLRAYIKSLWDNPSHENFLDYFHYCRPARTWLLARTKELTASGARPD